MSPGPSQRTVFPQSFQDLFEPSVSSQKKKRKKEERNITFLSALVNSRQAAPAPETPLLTKSGSRTAGGWSRSSRLPPSCVSPSHLAGPKHAGKLRGREGSSSIPAACAQRVRAHAQREDGLLGAPLVEGIRGCFGSPQCLLERRGGGVLLGHGVRVGLYFGVGFSLCSPPETLELCNLL